MTAYDLKNRPGRWRSGAIYVSKESSGEVVYEGPDVEEVPVLMDQLVRQLNAKDDTPTMVRAAMAHLNLVMVHPFRDGNGRMARCLQTLVLAREGVLAPVFSSVEEYLGADTQAYYDVLEVVGAGQWQPDRDALPWVRFILTAHLRQARTVLRRVKETERLWDELEKIAERHSLPERVISALHDAAIGFRVRRATYRAVDKDEITEQTASRDLHHPGRGRTPGATRGETRPLLPGRRRAEGDSEGDCRCPGPPRQLGPLRRRGMMRRIREAGQAG